MNKIIVTATYLFFLLCLSSCGADDDTEVQRSYLLIEDHLTSGNCDKALSAVLAMKEQFGDATYYKLLASAYGCKAGFSVTKFFATEITKVIPGPDLLSSLSTIGLAQNMTNIDDLSFYYLGKAIEVLSYSGGKAPVSGDPSASLRKATFGSYGAADLNSFLMYMLFVKNGMNMYFFGNTNALGVKGAGTIGVNECLFDYDTFGDADLNNYIEFSGLTGACNEPGTDTGSPDLTNLDTTLNLERACELVTDFNNLLDVLENISVADITEIDLTTLTTDIKAARQNFIDNVVTPKGYSNTLVSVKNASQCVTDFTGSEVQIGYYMAAMLETLHSR